MNGKPLPTNAEMAQVTADVGSQLVASSDNLGGQMPGSDYARLWLWLCNALSAARSSDAGRAAAIRSLSDGQIIDLAIMARDGLPVVVAAAEAVMANYGPEVSREQKALADHHLTVAVYRVLDEQSRARLKGTSQ